MRKNIKTYIYVVTAILPIVLSACSNKTDNNMPKSTKESTTTTFVEDTSSGITSTIEETTTEEDTTKLISVTEHEVINSTENITEQQQTQANIQQTTTVTSVNSTPVPVQTTPRLTDTTIPTPEIRTTPSFIPIPSETTTPTNKLDETIKQPMPSLIVNGVTKGEKYSYNDIEFTVDSVKTSFHSVSDDGYCGISLDINISSTESISPYCIYSIFNSNDDCIETGNIKFYSIFEKTGYTAFDHISNNRIQSDDFTIFIQLPNTQ